MKAFLIPILAISTLTAQPVHMWTGSTPLTDSSSVTWSPNLCTGTVPFTNPGTYPSPIYNLTAYTAVAGVPISCTFPVVPGTYSVLVHLIEPVKSFNAPQKRSFTILVNDQPLITGVDIYQRAGGVQIPYDVIGVASSAAAGITINFTQIKSSAIFAGIELIPQVQFADHEVPAGTVDRTNPIFTLAHAPNPPESLRLTWAGVELQAGVDYILQGNQITYSGQPTGGIVVATTLTQFAMPLLRFSAQPDGPIQPSQVVGYLAPLIPSSEDIICASYRY